MQPSEDCSRYDCKASYLQVMALAMADEANQLKLRLTPLLPTPLSSGGAAHAADQLKLEGVVRVVFICVCVFVTVCAARGGKFDVFYVPLPAPCLRNPVGRRCHMVDGV